MIPALVLTAGLATRLRPLSLVRAKAALPVASQPLVCRILATLRQAGVTEAVLNLHHLPETLTRIVGDGAALGMRVRYSWETPLLGSAGGPRRAAPILGSTSFLIVNGDTLASVDIAALVADHARSGALVTMAVTPNTEPAKYGGVVSGGDGVVTGFVRRGDRRPSHHYVGVQVAAAAAFEAVPPDTPYESVGALYPALIASRHGAVRVFAAAPGFRDIGTPRDYLDTSLAIAREEGLARLAGRGTHVAADAVVDRSILWDDVHVGGGASLRECIVTDGVSIPDGTSWEGVVIRTRRDDLIPGERPVGALAVSPLP